MPVWLPVLQDAQEQAQIIPIPMEPYGSREDAATLSLAPLLPQEPDLQTQVPLALEWH